MEYLVRTDELILDINGTESNATITASIIGSPVFLSDNDHLDFFTLSLPLIPSEEIVGQFQPFG